MANSDSTEEWRPVDGWPYEVSSLGRVRRMKPGTNGRAAPTLKASPSVRGYPKVCLCDGDRHSYRFVHDLVCRAFNGAPPSPRHEVGHRDGVRTNNNVGNVRWVTRLENHADKIHHGTSGKGAANSGAKLTAENVHEIRALLKTGMMQKTIGARFGVSRQAIQNIVNGHCWSWLQTELKGANDFLEDAETETSQHIPRPDYDRIG